MTEAETEATDHGHQTIKFLHFIKLVTHIRCRAYNFEYTHLYMIENVCIIQSILY